MLCQLNDELVFCHNDLLLGNILYDEIEHSIEFIDFEYAGANYQSYDIANHFCEFAGIGQWTTLLYKPYRLHSMLKLIYYTRGWWF